MCVFPQFLEERDGCSASFQKPVYELLSGQLWPIVCLEKVLIIYIMHRNSVSVHFMSVVINGVVIALCVTACKCFNER